MPGTGRNDEALTPVNRRIVQRGGGDGDNLTESGSTLRVQVELQGSALNEHLEKLLECPVCYNVILPPIISCRQGHNCCETCRASVSRCPVCRGELSGVRNLLAEQFLEICKVKCKNGCDAILPINELEEHYQGCDMGPIYCRECDQWIPFEDFLTHITLVDKLERQQATECSTGFEIDQDDLTSIQNRRITVWEPTWMFCYGEHFFCNLDFNGKLWWIWLSSLTPKGCDFKCQIILWSKLQQSEHTFFGTVHSIRTDPKDVLETGRCLILTDKTLRNFMYQGGIDVLVRIELTYVMPKTRRGIDVQSPLEIATNRPQPQNGTNINRTQSRQSRSARGGRDQTYTPARTLRSSLRQESRIPISVSSQLESALESLGERPHSSTEGSSVAVQRIDFEAETIPPSPPQNGATGSGIGRRYRYHHLRSRRNPSNVEIIQLDDNDDAFRDGEE